MFIFFLKLLFIYSKIFKIFALSTFLTNKCILNVNYSNYLNFNMAKEIFSIAAVFWILIPIGLVGGALLLKFQGD